MRGRKPPRTMAHRFCPRAHRYTSKWLGCYYVTVNHTSAWVILSAVSWLGSYPCSKKPSHTSFAAVFGTRAALHIRSRSALPVRVLFLSASLHFIDHVLRAPSILFVPALLSLAAYLFVRHPLRSCLFSKAPQVSTIRAARASQPCV